MGCVSISESVLVCCMVLYGGVEWVYRKATRDAST